MQRAPGQGEKSQRGEQVTGLERRGRLGPRRGERAWGWARCALALHARGSQPSGSPRPRLSTAALEPAPSGRISSIAVSRPPAPASFAL